MNRCGDAWKGTAGLTSASLDVFKPAHFLANLGIVFVDLVRDELHVQRPAERGEHAGIGLKVVIQRLGDALETRMLARAPLGLREKVC